MRQRSATYSLNEIVVNDLLVNEMVGDLSKNEIDDSDLSKNETEVSVY